MASLTAASTECRALVFHGRSIVMAVPRAELASVSHLVRRVINRVLSSQWIQFSFHHEVEEEASRCVVGHVAVQIDGPEEWMRLWRRWIWERDQVQGDMPDDTLLIEDLSNRVANSLHVHVWQGLLREEAARVDVLFG